MEAEPLRGQVLPDDGHLQIGGVLAPELGWQGQPEPSRGVGPAPHLGQELLPLQARDAPVFEVGARPLAPMVEEPDVVVGLLQGLDLGLDESIEIIERLLNVGRYGEVHAFPSRTGGADPWPDRGDPDEAASRGVSARGTH